MTGDQKLTKAMALGRDVEQVAADFANSWLCPSTLRLRLALASFHVCRQHAAAIALLVSERRYDSSARALLRPTIEASLRAEWLLTTARQVELQQFASFQLEKKGPGIGFLAKHLDKLSGQDFRVYALDLDAHHANSFTHGGAQTVGRHILGDSGFVGSQHNADECAAVVHKAVLWVANAGITLSHKLRCFDHAERFQQIANSSGPP